MLAFAILFGLGEGFDLPQIVGGWERIGIVSILVINIYLILTGRLVPARYYRQANDSLVRTQMELSRQLEVNQQAIETMNRLVDRVEKIEKTSQGISEN